MIQSNCPKESPRSNAADWYKGEKEMIAPSHWGYRLIGKNVAENKKSGSWTRVTRSKSCHVRMYVHAARPIQLKVRLVRMAPGQQSMTHALRVSPSAAMQTMKDAEYTVARDKAQRTSPRAMSVTSSGVASNASYECEIFKRKNVLKIESIMAPFIAEVASIPGATKAA